MSNLIEIEQASNLVKDHLISILSCNVRSLNSNVAQINECIKDLNFPKIICLSETFNPSTYAKTIPDYNLNVIKARKNTTGGGVGIWTHKSVNFTTIESLSKLKLDQVEFCHTLVNLGQKKLLIINIYRPPDVPKNVTMNDLSSLFTKCAELDLPTTYVGDLNIDLIKTNRFARDYENMIQSYELSQLVTSPTRICKTTKTLIDHVCVNQKVKATSITINSTVADHLPILTCLNSKFKVNKSANTHANDTNMLDYEKLIKKLENVPWDSWTNEFSSSSTDETFANFHGKLTRFLKESTTKIKNLERQRVKNHWVSKETITIKKKADKFRKKFYVSGSARHHDLKLTYHKLYQKKLREDRNTYFQIKLEKSKNNPKKIWRLINEATGRQKKGQNANKMPEIMINSQLESDPTKVCEGFNTFYQNVAVDLADTIPLSKYSFKDYLEKAKKSQMPLNLMEVTEAEVAQVIKNLKPKSSSGFDGISSKTIKKVAKVILKPLTFCINKSIKDKVFPTILKMSQILPLYKKGDENQASNFRPISMLSVISQILQKIINNQCDEHVKNHDLLHDKQFGFRAAHSTSHALFLTINEIEMALNQKKYVILLSLDLRMAFDTVNTERILPEKLRHYFQNEETCKLLDSFFKERKQFVQISNHKSRVINAKNVSVVQGSAIGPPTFSLYINDLPQVTDLDCVLFADDTTLILAGKSLENLEKKVNEELIKIKDYLDANKLSLNVAKTTFAVFCPQGKKVEGNIKIKIGEEFVKQTEETLFLGVTIDTKMQFRKHFENVLEKVKKGVNAMIAAKNLLSYKAKLKIYHSLVHSHLLYCSQVWLQKLSSSDIQKLVVLQKKSLRALFNVKYNSHTGSLFELSRIVKVEDIAKKENLMMMYKFKEKMLPNAIENMILQATKRHERQTRFQHNESYQKILIPNSSLKHHNILYKMLDYWNQSSIEIKNSTYSIGTVKKRIDHYLRLKHDHSCDKMGCYSCYRFDEEKLIKYMKF